MKSLFVLLTAFVFVSCNSGSGGSSSSASPDGSRVSTSISDSTLISFEQTAGVASYRPSFMDNFVARAYAADGNINCYSGDPVSFDMDLQIGATITDLQVDTTCGGDVELDIRREMLAALDNHIMILEVAGVGDVGPDYTLDFKNNNGIGFRFDVPHPTLEAMYLDGANEWPCKVDYIFKKDTGEVQISIGVDDFDWSFASLAVNQNTNNSPVGSVCDVTVGIHRTPDFRFKNGKIEMDESGTKQFSPKGCAKYSGGNVVEYNESGDGFGSCPTGYESTYERWCIDDDLDGNCDSI